MNKTSVIVFSKERPLQLYAYLESILHFSDIVEQQIYVIYVSHPEFDYEKVIRAFPHVNWIRENNFFDDLKKIISCADEYILFGCDDVIFTKNFSIAFAEKILCTEKDIFGFSFRLGSNINPLPKLLHTVDYYTWNWKSASIGHYSYPWELDCTLYRRKDVECIFSQFKTPITSPNFLENAFYTDSVKGNKQTLMASYRKGVAIVVTINRVQDDFANPVDSSELYDVLYLNDLFSKKNDLIDVRALGKCVNSLVHVDGRYLILNSFSRKRKIKRIIAINIKEELRIFIKKFYILNKYISTLHGLWSKLKNYKNRISSKFIYINVKSPLDTVDMLLSSRKSLSRFGDGEFALMKGESIPFQKAGKEIAKRLQDIIEGYNENLAVAIPFCMQNDYNKQYKSVKHFFSLWKGENIKFLCQLRGKSYYATEISQMFEVYRIYDFDAFYKKIRQLWNNAEIVIVANKNVLEKSKLEIFDNAKKIYIVDAPSSNAFDEYQNIFNSITNFSRDKLCIISLGPTASILAHDLSLCGYRALDIGHLWKDYECFLSKKQHTKDSMSIFFEPD